MAATEMYWWGGDSGNEGDFLKADNTIKWYNDRAETERTVEALNNMVTDHYWYLYQCIEVYA